jgi:hypothetical protein
MMNVDKNYVEKNKMSNYVKNLIVLFAMLLIILPAYAMHTSTLSHSRSIGMSQHAEMRENTATISAETTASTPESYSVNRPMSAESGMDEISMQDTIQTNLAA